MPDTDISATLHAQAAIRRLISAYCDAVRRLDGSAAGQLFAPDGRVQIADYPELVGREAVTEGIRKTFSKFNFLHQSCDTGLIDIDGDSARGRLGVFEANSRPDRDGVQLIFGTYEDEYRLLDEGWRFHRRRFSVQGLARVSTMEFQAFPAPKPAFTFGV